MIRSSTRLLQRTLRVLERRYRWVVGGFSIAVLATAGFFLSYPFDETAFDPDTGGPLRITDRHGTLLRQVPSDDGRPGRESWVRIDEIPATAILTLIASEDQNFYEHSGVDPEGLVRGLWLTLTTDGVYGGSTLTMQLARMMHSPGMDRTVVRKVIEIRAALGIERHLEKRDILEQYLNRAYYGRGAYGLEAAAQRYFGKPARSLSVGEATFLSVIPRGPAFYDPIDHPERVFERRAHLFSLLEAQGKMSAAAIARAEAQPVEATLRPYPYRAPHFVDWVLAELPEEHRLRGGTVVSTLDLPLQERLEAQTREHVEEQRRYGVTQAGAVVLDTESGAVRARVGSRDYHAADGQVNITTWRRHPGSALKPFVYGAAIEAGAAPSTVAYDVREASEQYQAPETPEHGPVPFRIALGSSYNFAAMHTIEDVGVEAVAHRLRLAGVTDLPRGARAYGSRLALGAPTVRLVDLTASYRFTVRSGRVVGPHAVERIERGNRRVFSHSGTETRVFSDTTAFLVMDILADPEARRPVFGHELPVDLPYPVVAKTGTAEGFSDTVAVVVTNEYSVGAWAGRFDGGATHGRPAMFTAGPLARAALLSASRGGRLSLPSAPSGLTHAAVCPLSGLRPSASCPHRRHDHFAAGSVPTETCDWHRGGRLQYPDALEGWARRSGHYLRQASLLH
ncbi:MAG: transglycosylase domain-containing protein [Myxococcota bacterium]